MTPKAELRRLVPRWLPRLFPLVAVLIALSACLASGPGGAVKSFYKAIENGKIEDALGLVSSQVTSSLGLDKTRAALTKASRDIHEKGGVAKFEIVKEDVVGEVAEVEIHIRYGNGTEETEKVKLVKEEGRWKIQPEK